MSGRDEISGTDETVEPPASNPSTDPTIGLPLAPGVRYDLPTVFQNKYERGHEIARGGMGRILEARDRRLGRTVALKEMLGAGDEDQELISRFEREAVISAKLQHPAIVAVYE